LTLRSAVAGLVISWAAALGIALLLAGVRKSWADAGASSLAGLLISVPTGVLTLLLMLAHQPASAIIALVLFPRVFRYARNILLKTGAAPHIVAARARGIGPVRLLATHVVWPAVPQLIALAGVSVSAALGAAIPVEVFADSPGVGHLAWEAALGRDLPLLITITVLVTTVTLMANAGSDVLNDALSGQSA
jgi:ABC-type dipeptide/oligopeptide/nickel transport system permease component